MISPKLDLRNPHRSENAVTFLETVRKTIDDAWHHNPKMNWLGMEETLRDVISARKRGVISDDTCINLCDEIIAAFTKRGHCS